VSLFTLGKLKKLRVVVSLILFIPVSFLFLDPWNSIPPQASNFLVSLQIIPSFQKILVYSGVTIAGLFFVLALTLAFGRVYCSTICPLGTLQDLIIRVSKKFQKRKRYQYKKPHYALHYWIFTAVTASSVAGSMALMNLLEPFSNFGRILTNAVDPIFLLGYNTVASLLVRLQVYALYNIPVRDFSLVPLLPSLLFLAVVAYMSYKHGRLFCNTLCPAGAFLGLASRLSLFKIAIDENTCTECGACEKVCKANCIESSTKRIDYGSCVNCFNCISSCPTEGVVYRNVFSKKHAINHDLVNQPRRKFVGALALPLLGILAPAFKPADTTRAAGSGYDDNRLRPITPPGSKSVRHFSSLCTACHLCVSACPTQVLYPSFLEYGLTGVFQPRMNYSSSYCNYDCNLCSQICPSGAILPVDAPAKKEIQIGKANFVKEDCVVVTNKKDCAACSEHCPTKAVHTVPYEGKLLIPQLDNDICVGCGACEHSCPTTPRKAIYVSPNPVHLQAKKPKVEKSKDVFDSKQDFPF